MFADRFDNEKSVFTLLVTLLIVLGIVLMVIILLQAGKGGGLAAMGGGAGTDTFVGGRQAATILTKSTWVGGGVFLFLALVISIMSSRWDTMDPILRDEFREGPPAVPQPVLPGEPTGPAGQTEPGEEGAAAPPAEEPPTPPPDQ